MLKIYNPTCPNGPGPVSGKQVPCRNCSGVPDHASEGPTGRVFVRRFVPVRGVRPWRHGAGEARAARARDYVYCHCSNYQSSDHKAVREEMVAAKINRVPKFVVVNPSLRSLCGAFKSRPSRLAAQTDDVRTLTVDLVSFYPGDLTASRQQTVFGLLSTMPPTEASQTCAGSPRERAAAAPSPRSYPRSVFLHLVRAIVIDGTAPAASFP